MTGTPTQLAAQTADTIHALVHDVRRDGYAEPADAYDTVAALAGALAVLPQLLHHTTQWLHGQHATGQLHADTTGSGDAPDLSDIVALTNAHLADAGHAAGCTAQTLDHAAQHLAGLRSTAGHPR